MRPCSECNNAISFWLEVGCIEHQTGVEIRDELLTPVRGFKYRVHVYPGFLPLQASVDTRRTHTDTWASWCQRSWPGPLRRSRKRRSPSWLPRSSRTTPTCSTSFEPARREGRTTCTFVFSKSSETLYRLSSGRYFLIWAKFVTILDPVSILQSCNGRS